MPNSREIGIINELECGRAKTRHADGGYVNSDCGTPQGIRLVLDLTSNDLQKYLSSVVDDFNPAASTTLGIRGYADKLTQLGRTIAAVSASSETEEIVGILAGYFNNPEQGFSFISAFHVRHPFRRMHIGRMLMDKAIAISRVAGFQALRLKVDKTNLAGIAFYEQYGFAKIGEDAEQLEMDFNIRGNCNDGM